MQGPLAIPPPPTELGYFTMGQRAELRGVLEGVTGGPGDSRNTKSLTSSPKHPVSTACDHSLIQMILLPIQAT